MAARAARIFGVHLVAQQTDAAQEVLEARIGTNRVPIKLNIQIDQILALRKGFFERL